MNEITASSSKEINPFADNPSQNDGLAKTQQVPSSQNAESEAPTSAPKLSFCPPAQDGIALDSKAYRRLSFALFAAGFSCFGLIYGVQPLIAYLRGVFPITAAESSLILSMTTGALGIFQLCTSALSDHYGRKSMMLFALFSAALLTFATAFVTSWHGLLALRFLVGIAISGLPAVAIAYLAEEMQPRALGVAVGVFIGGNAMGGLCARIMTGIVAERFSYHLAFAIMGALGLISSAALWHFLPPSKRFTRRRVNFGTILAGFKACFGDAGLPFLFLEGFLVMGVFVSLYNYIGFVLIAPPYLLSHTLVSFIFTAYLVGIWSASGSGYIASRVGSRNVLWVVIVLMALGVGLTLSPYLWSVIGGIVFVTIGFFGAHSVLSTWVGRRAGELRAIASSLYLLFYYAGSSFLGTLGGWFFDNFGWNGVLAYMAILLAGALLIAVRLLSLKPLAPLPR